MLLVEQILIAAEYCKGGTLQHKNNYETYTTTRCWVSSNLAFWWLFLLYSSTYPIYISNDSKCSDDDDYEMITLFLQILDTPTLLTDGSVGVKRNIFKQKPPEPDPSTSGCCWRLLSVKFLPEFVLLYSVTYVVTPVSPDVFSIVDRNRMLVW